MSKCVTAVGVMQLVHEDRIDLDAPVARYLTRWTLPVSRFDLNGVTACRLLSHTAGLTDGLGFGDYRLDERVPSLEESLRAPRASTGQPTAIIVGSEPGSRWQYSGGGYLILQLLVEEVTQQPFAAVMQREPCSIRSSDRWARFSRHRHGHPGGRRTAYRRLAGGDRRSNRLRSSA